jgi:replicative DNA helicase
MSMEKQRLNSNFLEKIIIKGMMADKDFMVLVSSVFEKNYFDDPNVSHAFEFMKSYNDKYNRIPDKESIIQSAENSKELKEFFENVESTEFDVSNSYEFLLEQSNDYLKEKALKNSILESIDEVENPEKRALIQKRIESALTKDIRIDLGLNYFEDLGVRLKRMFSCSERRVPTYFPVFDEYLNGGFPGMTLNVITAKVHMGKSNIMANFSARQILNGKNVALISLEMSEDAFATRIDSILSNLYINSMYSSDTNRKKLMEKLKEVKSDEKRGNLFIKEYPTGSASVLNFKSYLRELRMRGIDIDIVYVDYINLMRAAYKTDDNMYSNIKRISEELRGLACELKTVFLSVSQLNRDGFFCPFKNLDYQHIAESAGIPATCDFMAIAGFDEEDAVYENEVFYKIVKNRIGGKVGSIDKFYIDRRSLKMYDTSELDLWIEEASISGDERSHFERKIVDDDRRRR